MTRVARATHSTRWHARSIPFLATVIGWQADLGSGRISAAVQQLLVAQRDVLDTQRPAAAGPDSRSAGPPPATERLDLHPQQLTDVPHDDRQLRLRLGKPAGVA